MSKLKNFSYAFDENAGPLTEQELKNENFTQGNCRRAVQYFLYKTKNIFLKQEDVLLPNGYKNIGEFIFKEESIDFKKLKIGDVIYAENLRNKKGTCVWPLNKFNLYYKPISIKRLT